MTTEANPSYAYAPYERRQLDRKAIIIHRILGANSVEGQFVSYTRIYKKATSLVLVLVLIATALPLNAMGNEPAVGGTRQASDLNVEGWTESKLAKGGDTILINATTSYYASSMDVEATVYRYVIPEGFFLGEDGLMSDMLFGSGVSVAMLSAIWSQQLAGSSGDEYDDDYRRSRQDNWDNEENDEDQDLEGMGNLIAMMYGLQQLSILERIGDLERVEVSTLDLTYISSFETWTGTYTIPKTAEGGFYAVTVTATDGSKTDTDDERMVLSMLYDNTIGQFRESYDAFIDVEVASLRDDIFAEYDAINQTIQDHGGFSGWAAELTTESTQWNAWLDANADYEDTALAVDFLEFLEVFLQSDLFEDMLGEVYFILDALRDFDTTFDILELYGVDITDPLTIVDLILNKLWMFDEAHSLLDTTWDLRNSTAVDDLMDALHHLLFGPNRMTAIYDAINAYADLMESDELADLMAELNETSESDDTLGDCTGECLIQQFIELSSQPYNFTDEYEEYDCYWDETDQDYTDCGYYNVTEDVEGDFTDQIGNLLETDGFSDWIEWVNGSFDFMGFANDTMDAIQRIGDSINDTMDSDAMDDMMESGEVMGGFMDGSSGDGWFEADPIYWDDEETDYETDWYWYSERTDDVTNATIEGYFTVGGWANAIDDSELIFDIESWDEMDYTLTVTDPNGADHTFDGMFDNMLGGNDGNENCENPTPDAVLDLVDARQYYVSVTPASTTDEGEICTKDGGDDDDGEDMEAPIYHHRIPAIEGDWSFVIETESSQEIFNFDLGWSSSLLEQLILTPVEPVFFVMNANIFMSGDYIVPSDSDATVGIELVNALGGIDGAMVNVAAFRLALGEDMGSSPSASFDYDITDGILHLDGSGSSGINWMGETDPLAYYEWYIDDELIEFGPDAEMVDYTIPEDQMGWDSWIELVVTTELGETDSTDDWVWFESSDDQDDGEDAWMWGDIDSFSIDWGDDSTPSEHSSWWLEDEFDHEYEDAGTYTITLTVIDDADNEDTTTMDVTITEGLSTATSPIIYYVDYEPGMEDFAVEFDYDADDPDGWMLDYLWDFGDGTTSEDSFWVDHVYASAGTYTVVLTATDGDGNSDTYTIEVVATELDLGAGADVSIEDFTSCDNTYNCGSGWYAKIRAEYQYDPDTFTVDWDDGSDIDEIMSFWSYEYVSHNYDDPGTYTAVVYAEWEDDEGNVIDSHETELEFAIPDRPQPPEDDDEDDENGSWTENIRNIRMITTPDFPMYLLFQNDVQMNAAGMRDVTITPDSEGIILVTAWHRSDNGMSFGMFPMLVLEEAISVSLPTAGHIMGVPVLLNDAGLGEDVQITVSYGGTDTLEYSLIGNDADLVGMFDPLEEDEGMDGNDDDEGGDALYAEGIVTSGKFLTRFNETFTIMTVGPESSVNLDDPQGSAGNLPEGIAFYIVYTPSDTTIQLDSTFTPGGMTTLDVDVESGATLIETLGLPVAQGGIDFQSLDLSDGSTFVYQAFIESVKGMEPAEMDEEDQVFLIDYMRLSDSGAYGESGDVILKTTTTVPLSGIAVPMFSKVQLADGTQTVRFNIVFLPTDSNGDGVYNSYTPPAPDSDNDGVPDNIDDFPLDASETKDTDGDGVGDNADAFPTDPDEDTDSDGDGTGDNEDEFPEDPDRDGVTDEPIDDSSDGGLGGLPGFELLAVLGAVLIGLYRRKD